MTPGRYKSLGMKLQKRCIYFPRKDGVKTLASRLRTFDRLGQSSGDAGENENLAESALTSHAGVFRGECGEG